MEILVAVASSALVSALVGGVISYATQRRIIERKAQVDYEYSARNRLYSIIGPLRLQLLFAARDFVRRVAFHHQGHWNMNPLDYYASSFMYRILRPFALCQLIERQISIADFTVDSAALDLLRFSTNAERMMVDEEAILDHPAADWSSESQHLFRDTLRAAASILIVTVAERAIVMDYVTFAKELGRRQGDPSLRKLEALFDRCQSSLLENPILWVRLVGYGYLCSDLITQQGARLGFEGRPYDAMEMLQPLDEPYFQARIGQYPGVFKSIASQGL